VGHRASLVLALAVGAAAFGGCAGVEERAPGMAPSPPPAGDTGPPPNPTTLPASMPTPCAPPYPAGPATAQNVFCRDPAPLTEARVADVIDGDTLDVEIGGVRERVRLYGIDAPERGDRCFDEATARATALFSAEVRLMPGARDRDRYGRLLRYVYSPEGRSIDAQLIAEGLATAWTRDGELRFALIELEERARASDAGCLWR
jgi:micrococcal nuclease